MDIFFVISGYVITQSLLRAGADSGRRKLAAFYWRRFKRLTPALAVTVSATMVFSLAVMSPGSTLALTAETGVGAMLLFANVVISRSTWGGYFDAPAEANPLLNTWTLSVEEQFYLVFAPLLVLVLALRMRHAGYRWLPMAVLIAVGTVSLATALTDLPLDELPGGVTLLGFFSPIPRAWEFLAGALLVAVPAASRSHPLAVRTIFVGGSALIVASLVVLSPETRFPGPATLLPVVGAAAVLWSGAAVADGRTRFHVLTSRPMVYLGDRSYSLYLWHWPVIALAYSVWPGITWVPLAAAAISFLPAILSFRLVEQPTRRWSGGSMRSLLLVVVVLAVPLVFAAVASSVANAQVSIQQRLGLTGESLNGSVSHDDFFDELESVSAPCVSPAARAAADSYRSVLRCRQMRSSEPVDVVVLGDSHAEALFLGLASSDLGANVAYFQVVDGPVATTPGMKNILDEVVGDGAIKTVLLDSAWIRLRPENSRLADVVRQLTEAGKQVFIVDDVPEFTADPYWCKYQRIPAIPHQCAEDAEWNLARYDTVTETLEEAAIGEAGVEVLSTFDLFCANSQCTMAPTGDVAFRDSNHLNGVGSALVAERLIQQSQALRRALEVE